MKRKVIKRLKRKVKPYKHTIGYYEYLTFRDWVTNKLTTYKFGYNKRER